jgi:hypothetical protein
MRFPAQAARHYRINRQLFFWQCFRWSAGTPVPKMPHLNAGRSLAPRFRVSILSRCAAQSVHRQNMASCKSYCPRREVRCLLSDVCLSMAANYD